MKLKNLFIKFYQSIDDNKSIGSHRMKFEFGKIKLFIEISRDSISKRNTYLIYDK